MKLAIIGYGKMGHEIENIALKRQHEIVSVIDQDNQKDFTSEAFASADVAVEFTRPEASFDSIIRAFEAGVPVVSGTTGWLDRYDELVNQCNQRQLSFFYAPNFSIGVNLFFAVNRYLADLMNDFPAYDIEMEEVHHTQKLDAPSGTAIQLAKDIIAKVDRKNGWQLDNSKTEKDIAIRAIREGQVKGTHTITYDSEIDYIQIKHFAKNRKGFAQGAVLAAEYIVGKQGIFSMSDMLQIKALENK